jgi:gliding motility-associated-like protein
MRLLLFIFLFIGLHVNSYSTSVYTVCDGYWNDTTIWLGGVLPASGDDIFINHIVRLDTSNYTFNNNQILIDSDGNLCGDTLEVANGSTLTIVGSINILMYLFVNGTQVYNYGTTYSNGTIQISGAGGYWSNMGSGYILTGTGFCPPFFNNCSSPNARFDLIDTVCVGYCVDLTDLSNVSPITLAPITNWNWSLNGANISNSTLQNPTNVCFNELGDFSISLTVTDSNGTVSNTYTKNITINGCEELQIPTVFTPNSDGMNDVFNIVGTDITGLEMQIYNRWGQLLFETNQINEGWNGRTTAGNIAPDGTYFYIINMIVDNEPKLYKGTLSLIR